MMKIIPFNKIELRSELSKFLNSSFKELTVDSTKISMRTIIEEAENYLENKGYKVRVLTKGGTVAAIATGGWGILAKAAHIIATYDPEIEIRRNLITGNVDIVKMKK